MVTTFTGKLSWFLMYAIINTFFQNTDEEIELEVPNLSFDGTSLVLHYREFPSGHPKGQLPAKRPR